MSRSRRVRAFANGREVEITPTMQAAIDAVGRTGGPVRLLSFGEAGTLEDATGRVWSVKVERFVGLILENLAACYHRDWRLVGRAA